MRVIARKFINIRESLIVIYDFNGYVIVLHAGFRIKKKKVAIIASVCSCNDHVNGVLIKKTCLACHFATDVCCIKHYTD